MSDAYSKPCPISRMMRHTVNPDIVRTVYSGIFRHIQGHSCLFRHFQAYSGTFSNIHPCSGILKDIKAY